MPTGGGRVRHVLAVLACAVVAVGLGAAPAAAHDEIVGTTPADGSTVETAPDEVVLTFAEPAAALGTQVVVTGPDAVTVSQGDVRLVGTTVVQPLVGTRPAGAYRVDWRVTSVDGHPVTGTFTFTAAGPLPAPIASTPPTSPTAAPAASPPAVATTALAPAPSTSAPTPGAAVAPDVMSTSSGSGTLVGILILVLVVLALVVVRIGRAHSLRRITAARPGSSSWPGPGGPGEPGGPGGTTGGA